MQRVVHVKKDPYDVYVGRGSKWGNPYRIGDPHPQTGEQMTRQEVIALYKEHIVRGAGRPLLRDLGELEGQTLGCFCAKKGGVSARDPLVCHGQILLLLLEHRRRKIAQKAANNNQRGREEVEFRHTPATNLAIKCATYRRSNDGRKSSLYETLDNSQTA